MGAQDVVAVHLAGNVERPRAPARVPDRLGSENNAWAVPPGPITHAVRSSAEGNVAEGPAVLLSTYDVSVPANRRVMSRAAMSVRSSFRQAVDECFADKPRGPTSNDYRTMAQHGTGLPARATMATSKQSLWKGRE